MVDILVIDPDTFRLRKTGLNGNADADADADECKIDDRFTRLEEKMRVIIENHCCFKEENVITAPPANYQNSHSRGENGRHHNHQRGNNGQRNRGMGHNRRGHHHGGGFYNAHGSINQQRISLFAGADPTKREITGLLNKISNRTCERLLQRLLFLCTTDSSLCQYIVETILSKCKTQDCFMSMYIKLLAGMHSQHASDVQAYTLNFVLMFKECLRADLAKVSELDAANNSYDVMCNFFREKKIIINANRTILRLIEKGLVFYDTTEHYDFIWMTLNSCTGDPAQIDIVTQCMYDVICSFTEELVTSANVACEELTSFYEQEVKKTCGMNTQFKWKDMIEALNKKLEKYENV